MSADDVKAVEVLDEHSRLDFDPHRHDETGRKPWTCRSCGATVAHSLDNLAPAIHAHQADVLAAAGLLADPDALGRAKAEALREAADEMPLPSSSHSEHWDDEYVQYDGWERSPNDRTPRTWLRARANRIDPASVAEPGQGATNSGGALSLGHTAVIRSTRGDVR